MSRFTPIVVGDGVGREKRTVSTRKKFKLHEVNQIWDHVDAALHAGILDPQQLEGEYQKLPELRSPVS